MLKCSNEYKSNIKHYICNCPNIIYMLLLFGFNRDAYLENSTQIRGKTRIWILPSVKKPDPTFEKPVSRIGVGCYSKFKLNRAFSRPLYMIIEERVGFTGSRPLRKRPDPNLT